MGQLVRLTHFALMTQALASAQATFMRAHVRALIRVEMGSAQVRILTREFALALGSSRQRLALGLRFAPTCLLDLVLLSQDALLLPA